jgi:CRISPR system Cascade subunit CasE
MTNLVKLLLTYEQMAREKIVDNYAWHKKAWTLFDHHPELKQRKIKHEKDKCPTPFLSRFMQKSHHIELLLVSDYQPKKPDWCRDAQWQMLTISDDYLSQPTYWFDLYANPTKSVKKPDGQDGFTKNGRRLTLMDQVSQIDWLTRKAIRHGFMLRDDIPLQIDKPVDHRFNKKGEKGLHIGVRFQGALEVTDQKKFKQSFREGIGTAKGFGFGLLLIKPLQF